MKCIQYKDGRVLRVTDSKADLLVSTNQAVYAPKNIWKEKIRDIEEIQELEELENKEKQVLSNETKKPKKRKEKTNKKILKSRKNKQKKLENTMKK